MSLCECVSVCVWCAVSVCICIMYIQCTHLNDREILEQNIYTYTIYKDHYLTFQNSLYIIHIYILYIENILYTKCILHYTNVHIHSYSIHINIIVNSSISMYVGRLLFSNRMLVGAVRRREEMGYVCVVLFLSILYMHYNMWLMLNIAR